MKPIKSIKLTAVAFAVASALVLSGCETTSAPVTTQPKAISGVITGFGSIFVDGVEYETNTANIEVEGQTASDDSGLKLGMYVSLEGDASSNGMGVAAKVKYADDVEGQVIANNIATDGTLNIMGQTVHVDASTVFESKVSGQTTAADIAVGNRVEVSGYSNNGEVYATRIEVKAASVTAGEEMELKGIVASLDTTAKTFSLGKTVVNYSGASVEATLADGLFVEVKTTSGFVNSQLVASKVEVENGGTKGDDYTEHKKEGKDVKIEGVLTAALTDGQIEVNGTKIKVQSGDVEYKHGTSADLKVGVKLKVEVDVATDGSLSAKEISFRAAGNRKLVGAVEAIDSANNTVTVLGEKITVNNFTMVKDEDDSKGSTDRYFHLKSLAVGDWIELRVFKDDTGNLVATKLERNKKNEANEISLKGAIESYDASTKTLVVNGVSIDLSNIKEGDVSKLTAGAIVEVEGKYSNSVWSDVKVEIKSSSGSSETESHQESHSVEDLDG